MTSTVPVTAWQFNPLKYTLDRANCTRITKGAGGCSRPPTTPRC